MNDSLNKKNFEILDSMSDGVIIIDKEFKIKYFNKTAEKISGISKSNVIGKICKSVCSFKHCEFHCPVEEVLKTDKHIVDLESNILNTNGEIIPIKLNASIIKDKQDQPVGGIISFRDSYLKADINSYDKNNQNFCGIIGKSKPMLELYDVLKEISSSDATVLITGETGVGKELFANAIQKLSSRKNQYYVKVNCGVLSPHLLVSELFGHVKGAFTDASRDRMGRFEYADGGTLFLDEIGELPFDVQSQLLRILQEGTFEKLGESKTRKVNVRLIASTNVKLDDAIKNKRFREDLYYRLNVIPINIKPLRERREDIPLLADFFIRRFSAQYSKRIDSISDQALNSLITYSWPGNVRELENTIEYAFLRSKREGSLCNCSLPVHISKSEFNAVNDLKTKQNNDMEDVLLTLLKRNNWNKSKVAKILGVNRSTIYRRLKALEC